MSDIDTLSSPIKFISFILDLKCIAEPALTPCANNGKTIIEYSFEKKIDTVDIYTGTGSETEVRAVRIGVIRCPFGRQRRLEGCIGFLCLVSSIWPGMSTGLLNYVNLEKFEGVQT